MLQSPQHQPLTVPQLEHSDGLVDVAVYGVHGETQPASDLFRLTPLRAQDFEDLRLALGELYLRFAGFHIHMRTATVELPYFNCTGKASLLICGL